MRIYIYYTGCHPKNVESFRKMLARPDVFYIEANHLTGLDNSFDYLLCLNDYVPPNRIPPNCKVIYGPHFFVFPTDRSHPIWKHAHDSRFVYNTLSDWNLKLHSRMCNAIQFVSRPFGIDLDSIPKVENTRNSIMVYCKFRDTSLYSHVTSILSGKGLKYSTVIYGSYNDADFKAKLMDTKFVVWIGCHESQGFAFQETLAMNVPILVWDVRTMCEEIANGMPSYADPTLYATAASYWSDDECGIKFYDSSEFEGKFDDMSQRYTEFEPRKFIERELSLDSAFKRMFV